MVPSSPKGPCSRGKTTSTCPASEAAHPPEVEPSAAHVVLPLSDAGTARSPSSRRVSRLRSSVRSTSSSRCCTARSARTARSRACSSSPTCRYVGAGVSPRAVGMDKHLMKLVLAGAGLPVGPYAVITAARLAARPGRRRRRSPPSACPLFVKPARGRLEHRHHQGRRPRRPRRAIEAARAHDPKVARRGRRSSAARSSAACSRASTATRREAACSARSW